MAKRRPTYALTAGARADGATIAPATDPARCEWCGIMMTPAIGERAPDDQIRVPGLPWPVCVRCGRERGLVVTDG